MSWVVGCRPAGRDVSHSPHTKAQQVQLRHSLAAACKAWTCPQPATRNPGVRPPGPQCTVPRPKRMRGMVCGLQGPGGSTGQGTHGRHGMFLRCACGTASTARLMRLYAAQGSSGHASARPARPAARTSARIVICNREGTQQDEGCVPFRAQSKTPTASWVDRHGCSHRFCNRSTHARRYERVPTTDGENKGEGGKGAHGHAL
jgi:hypothetical protein